MIRYFIPSETYTRVDTSRTITLKSETVTLQWRLDIRGIGPGLMGIISRVKSELKKNEAKIHWPSKEEQKVPYARIEEWVGQARAYEIDLSGAYVHFAHKIGALSESLRKRLMGCAKASRLVALGAAATRRTVTEYKRGKPGASHEEQDPLGKRFFDALSCKVASTMDQMRRAAGAGFVYYWADAIFVRKGHLTACLKRARELGTPINEPEQVEMEIRGGQIEMKDGRTFIARTIERNPFMGADSARKEGVRQMVYRSGKKIELASSEDLDTLWRMARAGKTLNAAEGLELYRSLAT
jgi:hypothetical protein